MEKKLKICRFLTTDTAAWERFPDRYRLVTETEWVELREAGRLVYEGEEKGLFDSTVPVALTLDDVRG